MLSLVQYEIEEEEFIQGYTNDGDCDRCGFALEGECHLQCTHGQKNNFFSDQLK